MKLTLKQALGYPSDVENGCALANRDNTMTLKEMADKLETLDVDVFASLLGFEYSHDDQPEQAKKMIIDALRFSDQHGLKAPRPKLDDAD